MRITPTGGSAITALLAKFAKAGIEPKERKFTFSIDSIRDRYGRGSPASDLGAKIRPIEQPSKRKPDKKRINQIKRREGNHKITEVKCVSCGATIQAKNKRRLYCDDGCKNNVYVARRRAQIEARKLVAESEGKK